MKQRKHTTKEKLYTRITHAILDELRQGVRPWNKPWSTSGDVSIPLRHNRVPYRGINVLILWMQAVHQGYTSPIWMTYRQAKALGGQVRKGEQGTPVVFAETFEKKDEDEDGEEVLTRIPLLRQYTVFNVGQIDGLPEEYYAQAEAQISENERLDLLEDFLVCIGVEIRHKGNCACYLPDPDRIHMPPFIRFKSAESYYATLFHELIHWTGPRLERDFGSKSRSEGYAIEELVAEIGAAFLCARLGIAPAIRRDHAPYIASWLTALEDNHKLIFRAAAHAQRAVEHLIELWEINS